MWGLLTPAGVASIAQRPDYIEPQLAYFTDIIDYRQARARRSASQPKMTDSITTSFNWFYSREDDTNFELHRQGVVQRPGCTAGLGSPIRCRASTRPSPTRSTATASCRTARSTRTAPRPRRSFRRTYRKANNFQWLTKFDDGGPLRGIFDAAYAKATSNLQAAQADVEHGLYTTSAGVATSPAAPGCNNGSSFCGPNPPGNHGYEFTYANGGTSGLPSVSYLAPYADILNNPAYTTFKSNWAWANLTDNKQFCGQGGAQ